jgi:hypothetical protein
VLPRGGNCSELAFVSIGAPIKYVMERGWLAAIASGLRLTKQHHAKYTMP